MAKAVDKAMQDAIDGVAGMESAQRHIDAQEAEKIPAALPLLLTPEQVEALPLGSVVADLDENGEPFLVAVLDDIELWRISGGSRPWSSEALLGLTRRPGSGLTVLYTP